MGFLPVFFPPEGRLGHCPVQRLPVPFDPENVIVLGQSGLPEFAEHAPLLPALEVPVQAAAGPELGRDGLPVAARPQDVEDAVENLAVRQAGTPTPRGSPDLGQEWRDPVPQRVRETEFLDDTITCGGHDDFPQRANRWALTLYPRVLG